MPEESTRTLLKLFGMAMTDFEEQTRRTLERVSAPGAPLPPDGDTLELVEAWLRANGEVVARWGEVTRLLLETQARGQEDLSRLLARWRQGGR
jgi:hypothetical protein